MLGARIPGCTARAKVDPAAAPVRAALQLLLEMLASPSGDGQAQRMLLGRRAMAYAVEGVLTGCSEGGALAFYLSTAPRNLEAAETTLRDEIRRFFDHPPDAAMLAVARERLIARWVLANQKRADRSLQIARALLWGQPDPALSGDSPVDSLRAIDGAAIQAVARRYLRDELWVRAAVLPESQQVALGGRGATLRAVDPAPRGKDTAEPSNRPTGRPSDDKSGRVREPPSAARSAKGTAGKATATASPPRAEKSVRKSGERTPANHPNREQHAHSGSPGPGKKPKAATVRDGDTGRKHAGIKSRGKL